MTTEAAPFDAPDPQELTALFPGYSVDSLIACGGMGAVYHARQIALDREVAIKILPREFSSDAEFRDGFAAEAKAMAKLNHPNLIGVYDFGEVDGMLFIIMEFVSGQSLYEAAYGIAVEPRETARLMSEIAAGIAEAHRHGILHRDIKPANVLLDAHLRPKIGDFGLARPVGAASKEGEAIFGTPHYTAPEVVDHPSQVDARADIFSLGVVLHELLTSKLPASDPRPPSAICGCSPKFDEIVKRATQPVPSLRYPDADSMVRDLAKLAVAPVVSPSPQMGKIVRPPVARRATGSRTVVKSSGGISWGWVVVILVLAGGAYFAYQSRQNPKKIIVTPPQLPTASATPTTTDPSRNIPPPTRKTDRKATDLPGPANQEIAPDLSEFSENSSDNVYGSLVPPGAEPTGPAPIFDVEGFFVRARNVMKEKTQSVRATRNRALADNVSELDRELSKLARRAGSTAGKSASTSLDAIRKSGNRIPFGFKVEGLPEGDYSKLVSAAREGEKAADTAYIAGLKPHAETYIHGIQLQIERLADANDPGALRVLKTEIAQIQEDDQHFAYVLEK